MIRYASLLMLLLFIGCKEEEKEPPFETLYLTPVEKDTSGFIVYEMQLKRYLNESIGDAIERNKDYGITMRGKWYCSGVIIEIIEGGGGDVGDIKNPPTLKTNDSIKTTTPQITFGDITYNSKSKRVRVGQSGIKTDTAPPAWGKGWLPYSIGTRLDSLNSLPGFDHYIVVDANGVQKIARLDTLKLDLKFK